MTARILVVDDVIANVTLLKAKLQAAYYTVLTATSGAQALEIAQREELDLVLLDVMMPEMDGFEVCRRMKADRRMRDVPVVMVTALDQPSDRLQGLDAGADDFLTKPANDIALFARVRSLVRVKMMIDELKMRKQAFLELGLDAGGPIEAERGVGRIVIGEPREPRAQAMSAALTRQFGAICEIVSSARGVLAATAPDAGDAPELIIFPAGLGAETGSSLCSELRARPHTRRSAIMVVADNEDYTSVAHALDVGANDYVMRPFDEAELIARTRAQVRRERYAARLRAEVDAGLQMAVRDPLTGLHNRRYADQYIKGVLAKNTRDGAPAAALLFDLDRFKSINDSFGHAAGDAVLVEFSDRMRSSLRGVDLCARYGGEEFLVFIADTDDAEAFDIADRVRSAICDRPFLLAEHGDLSVTVSVGVATGRGVDGEDQSRPMTELMARADEALYASKEGGRNRVTLAPRAGSSRERDAG